MLRTILVLALASSAWADTVCTRDPRICDSTYGGGGGTILCAPPRPLCTTNERGAAEGGRYLFAGVGRAAPGGDGGQPSRRVVA